MNLRVTEMQIIGIPSAFGCIGKSKGVAKAPAAIAEHLRFILSQQNSSPLDYAEIPINHSNFAETTTSIEHVARTAERGSIFLGGDHSITYPLVKGIAKEHPSIALVVFDAHPDCVHTFSPPTQEDVIRVLVEEEVLVPQRIFLVGLRAIYPDEATFLTKKNIRCYTMDAIFDLGMQQVMDALTEQLLSFQTLYVSIDIDCLDPAFAPGVDYPEPGGLSSRELLYALHRLSALKSFSYIDVVEVNPEKDKGETAWVAAKLVTGIRRF